MLCSVYIAKKGHILLIIYPLKPPYRVLCVHYDTILTNFFINFEQSMEGVTF